MSKLEEIINVVEVKGSDYTLNYLEFAIDEKSYSSEFSESLDRINEDFTSTLSLEKRTKKIKLDKDIKCLDKIENEILTNYILAGYKNTDERKIILELDKEKVTYRKIISKILAASKYISQRSRVGSANTVILNLDIYNKISKYIYKLNMKFIIKKDLTDDIIVYRKSKYEYDKGIIMFKNDNKYNLVKVGDNFYTHYATIKLL